MIQLLDLEPNFKPFTCTCGLRLCSSECCATVTNVGYHHLECGLLSNIDTDLVTCDTWLSWRWEIISVLRLLMTGEILLAN